MAKKYNGYIEDSQLPIKPGQTVTIRKGATVRSTAPKRKLYTAGKTYKVKVDHVLNGRGDPRLPVNDPDVNRYGIESPSVRWAGPGGYWCWVDLNEIPEANPPSDEASQPAVVHDNERQV